MPPTFQSTYNFLNPAQKQAVDLIEGPVMVIAGPGTGKTQVLAARIANILLKTDAKPHSILALTFTESAAKNMRQRLVKMIGKTGYYVQIQTFHSFCSEIIRTYPEYFPIDRGSEPLSDLERYELFQSIVYELDLEKIKPLNAPLFYMKDIISGISNLKREGISIEKYGEILQNQEKEMVQLIAENEDKKGKKRTISKTELNKIEKNLAKNQELIKIYEEYEKRLRTALRFDFDDMIALVAEAFQKEEMLLREYQENLHYFLVDEYQDTNSAQNKVVDLLASYWGDAANVFTVGDPNQAIYRFQGASVENMLGFAKRYGHAKVITLDIGYRCSQNLYDVATKLIAENHLGLGSGELPIVPQMTSAKSEKQNSVQVFKAPSQTLEVIYVVEEIQKLIGEGVNPSQIAVLYRHNADEELLAEALEKWGIRYEVDGGSNVLGEESIRQLLTFFQVLVDVRTGVENEQLFEIMMYPWLGLDNLLVMKVGRAAGKARVSIFDLINLGFEEFDNHHLGNEVTAEDFEQLKVFVEKMMKWSSQDMEQTFNAWFEMIVDESGFLKWLWEQDTKVDLLNNLNSLFREIKALISQQHNLKLADFLKAIDTIREHNLKINMEDLNVREDAVRLSTVHRAKGQEWQYVFMVHCLDGKWGNNRKRELIKLPDEILENTDLSEKERNEDERRLFYVGLTRAQTLVQITYPETIVNDNRTKEVVASLFIEELMSVESGKQELVRIVENKQIEAQAEEYLLKLLQPPAIKPVQTSEKEFFASLVRDFKLSVTALNIYLRDPEEFKQNVLLRVPRAKPIPMIFGSAVHFAFERMYKNLQMVGEISSLEKFLADFESALEKEPLTEDELKKRLKYGREILTKYYENYSAEEVNPFQVELFIGGGHHKAILDDIYLTGRIDRIDWVDRAKKTVRVVDYKTGKAKSLNDIEGKTIAANLSPREQSLPESIRGPYKRQLLFYKLLADLDPSFNYEVVEGVFDFVEPNKQTGKLVRRHFSLEKEAVNDLKKLIKEVMEEIRELGFLG